MRRGFSPLRWALATVVAVSAVSGCSGGDPAPVPPTSTGAADGGTQALVDCMRERGWDATFDESDGSMLVTDVPDAQSEQYARDNLECQAQAGIDADPAALTDDQLHELYQHEVATAECLRGEGVDVPEPSSEQAFHDAYASGSAFSAYAAVGNVSEDEWNRLNAACPQLPEGW
jgi:hypothetical protein